MNWVRRKRAVRPVVVGVLVAAVTTAMIGGLAPAASASFVPLAQFDCGSAGTFYSEVMPIPAPLPAPFAPAPEAKVRLLAAEGGETNSVIVLLQVTSLSTGQIIYTTPGLLSNEANPELVTCTITRLATGVQFEGVGLLTSA
jgi:hypothetical protein